MARTPHHTQVVLGPASARPSAAITPEWLWYYATDEGAFWRAGDAEWRRATPPVEDTGWTPLPMWPGWSASAAAAVRAHGGRVELRGTVSGTSADAITELPVDHRPADTVRVPVATGAGLAVLVVEASGRVSLALAEGADAVCLNAVTFAR